MAKYGRVAEQNNLWLTPAAFSHAGQTHDELKLLLKSKLNKKLIDFDGEAIASKARSAMKCWSKRISMAIANTASRNVAFKVAKMRESIMEDQDEFLIRKSECEEVGLETSRILTMLLYCYCFSYIQLSFSLHHYVYMSY